jgi:HD superfamily phosphohydrolase YqeK
MPKTKQAIKAHISIITAVRDSLHAMKGNTELKAHVDVADSHLIEAIRFLTFATEEKCQRK